MGRRSSVRFRTTVSQTVPQTQGDHPMSYQQKLELLRKLALQQYRHGNAK